MSKEIIENKNFDADFNIQLNNTVILSNFRRTRTVPHPTVLHSISSYQTQTTPNYFYNKTRVRQVESSYRTIIKNLELFLKTRAFLKKKTIKYL